MTRKPGRGRRIALIFAAIAALVASIFVSAGSASAATVTKKCTTTLNGVAQPSYNVDSMAVTRSFANGKYTYRVEHSPSRTVTRNLSSGGVRYIDHHIDTIQMYETYYTGKTVNWPANVTYFTSSYYGMNFYMKAHVTDSPNYEIFPTCRIYF